ncbi:hypothetical protein OG226_12570 [Streptomyces sp. NBC_01261]|uniref:hypothetical protein n=1 Tax=Streptomyces sp. NBC_01261 TaxID=2903802 RepID=UPI002E373D9F|nr:hypothetical protein [Streptomyces sp. NBC_01261]
MADYETDHEPVYQAATAAAVGIHLIRIEKPGQIRGSLRETLSHDGRCLMDMVTDPHELSIPRHISGEQMKGFVFSAGRRRSTWPEPICGTVRGPEPGRHISPVHHHGGADLRQRWDGGCSSSSPPSPLGPGTSPTAQSPLAMVTTPSPGRPTFSRSLSRGLRDPDRRSP